MYNWKQKKELRGTKVYMLNRILDEEKKCNADRVTDSPAGLKKLPISLSICLCRSWVLPSLFVFNNIDYAKVQKSLNAFQLSEKSGHCLKTHKN